MKRMLCAGVLAIVVLAGCSDDDPGLAPPASTTPVQTSSVAAAVEPASPTPAPPVESEAAGTQDAVAPPEAPTPDPIDPVLGSDRPTGEQLYVETCQQFVTAIDALAATGLTSREQAADGISAQLQANPSWTTVPPEDQQQMLRGLDAAGIGRC
ncbi:hypothetical protein [Rhodococcus sp. P1Y]|uniref:hypothetical protein n=1 Tax=Rhodococcus sp. P1Y TaxID=1302308 RepID=UPI000EB3D631|nr:hypothetical protein [Rhodococcus sp. P1Y]AYJ47175.1 hypothetical protein D8W71_01180 [Rhodococcus sp. P1Y]